MHIHLIRSSDVAPSLYQEVYELLISCTGPLDFRKHNTAVRLPEETLPWTTLFDECNSLRQLGNIPAEDFVILVTTRRNELNWFSAFDPAGSNSIFIDAGDWDFYVPYNTKYPIAYEVAENILGRMMFGDFQDAVQRTHKVPRGCISDMCSWKPDITLKIRTADICADCLQILDERGVAPGIIQQALALLDLVRHEVLFSKIYHDRREVDDTYPFPMAITRRKMNLTVEPLRKFLLMLDHFDSIVRTSVFLFGNVLLGDNFETFWRAQQLHARPALGHWVTALKNLSLEGAGSAEQAIDVPSDFFERVHEVAIYSEREQIVNLRNQMRGHGYVNLQNRQYQREYERYIPILREIERTLFPILSRFQICQINGSDRIEASTFRIQARVLMGSHPDFADTQFLIRPVSLDDVPIVNEVYAHTATDQTWYPLHPYILYQQCPECGHPRVLVSDGEQYIDPYMGHRVRIR